MPAQMLSEVYLDVYQRLATMELGISPNVKKDTIKENVDATYQSIDRFHEMGIFVKPEE